LQELFSTRFGHPAEKPQALSCDGASLVFDGFSIFENYGIKIPSPDLAFQNGGFL